MQSDLAASIIERGALVASAASAEHYQPMLDVGSSPVHVPSARVQAALADHRYPYAMSREFYSFTPWDEVTAFLQKHAGGVSFEAHGRYTQAALADQKVDEFMLEVTREHERSWSVTIAAATREMASKWMEAMAELLPMPPPPPPAPPRPWNVLPVDFWMQDPMSGTARSRNRDITVHSWNEIQGNYPSTTLQPELAALMGLEQPQGGKLVLFHGPPGTGKTRAIMALMSEWRDWCSASVVTDADRFFGNPDYVNSIVFGSVGMRNWLLLVIEDGDEFMNVDARDSKGQSIARLLNLCDGIVGQGLNLLTLISTNVNVEQLNPAVVRSGRCMANLHFGSFGAADAAAWAKAHGHTGIAFEEGKQWSLAELYALIGEGGDPVPSTEVDPPV